MSKMSQLHAELTEQATELGFETIQDALNSGYDVDYEKGKLVKRGLSYSETVEFLAKAHEEAHEAWLADKETALEGLDDLLRNLKQNNGEAWKIAVVEFVINFIKKGEV